MSRRPSRVGAWAWSPCARSNHPPGSMAIASEFLGKASGAGNLFPGRGRSRSPLAATLHDLFRRRRLRDGQGMKECSTAQAPATLPSPIIPPVEACSPGRYVNSAKVFPRFRRHLRTVATLIHQGGLCARSGGALSQVSTGKAFRTRRFFHRNKACNRAGTRYSQAGKWCTSVDLSAADVGKTNVDGGSLRGRNLTIAWSRTLLHGKLAKLPVWKRPP